MLLPVLLALSCKSTVCKPIAPPLARREPIPAAAPVQDADGGVSDSRDGRSRREARRREVLRARGRARADRVARRGARSPSRPYLASIAATGSPTLGGTDDFHLTAKAVPGAANGLEFPGLGAGTIPFAGGTLCVQPPLKRTAIQSSGASGGTCLGAFDHLLAQSEMAAHGLLGGGPVYARYWFRDPPDAFGAALSDAIRWVTCP